MTTTTTEVPIHTLRACLTPGEFHVYTERRWTAMLTINTEGQIVKRRESGEHGEYVENYLLDEATGTWVLHGPSWGPDQVEQWVNGELASTNNTDEQFTMRTVAGRQVITDLAEAIA